MSTQNFGDILVFQTPQGKTLGFHSRNLELAALSPRIWESLTNSQPTADQMALLDDLRQWHFSTSLTTKEPIVRQGVRTLTINVTQVCNLHCTYCAAGGDGSYGDPIKKISVDKTIPFLKKFLEQTPDDETFRITFLGGEPLLYPEGIRVLAEVARSYAKVHFTVVTNGTLFTPANIQLLNDIRADITISLDGPPEVNDVVRPSAGGRGATQQIIAGIKSLLQNRSNIQKIGVSGVFGKNNLNVMSAYEFYKGLGVDWYDFTFDHTEKSEDISKAFSEQLCEVGARAYAEGGETSLRKIMLFDSYFNSLDNQQRVENFCGSGKHFVMMDANNNLYSCPWKVGQPKEAIGHGAQIWPEKIADLRAPLIEANNCHSCWARYLCGGGCMFMHENKTGDKHQVDNNFCERTRLLIKQTLMYYELCRGKEVFHEESEEKYEQVSY